MKLLERLAVVLAAFVLAVAIIALLSGGLLAGRDAAGITGSTSSAGVGAGFADLGHAHLRPGQLHPPYDSTPPTSGAHVPVPILRDGTEVDDDQLLQALETGDVVFMYGSRQPPAALRTLATTLAPPFTPTLAAAGQAVILARRTGTNGVLGIAWTRLVHVRAATDPLLGSFARLALGQGAPGG